MGALSWNPATGRLDRVGAESSAKINAAHEHSLDSSSHVQSSRRAIDRSLELLRKPFKQIRD